MTDDGATFPPGPAATPALFRQRGLYLGYRAFGDAGGTVLIDPRVARELRSAAEFATQEHRFTGGLLYGRRWTDDEGGYLVVSGFLDAGPRDSGGDWLPGDGPAGSRGAAGGDFTGDFTLTDARLRQLRDEAARMYSTSLEVGWWRTLPALGEFGPADLVTQSELVERGGIGLLVYGSGEHWGTAYLGPDGHAAGVAGTLVAADEEEPAGGAHEAVPFGATAGTAPRHAAPYGRGHDGTVSPDAAPAGALPYETGDTGPYDTGPYDDWPYDTGPYDTGPYDTGPYDTGPYDTGADDRAPDDLVLDDTPLIDAAEATAVPPAPAGGTRSGQPAPGTTAPSIGVPGTTVATRRPAALTRRPRAGAVDVTSRDWYLRPPNDGLAGPRMPADAKIVIALALLAFVGAAILIGALMSSVLIAVIAAIVFVLVVFGFVWMSRL